MRMRSRTLESRTESGERKDRLGELRGVSSPSWLVVGLADVDTVEVQTFKYGLSSVRSGYNGWLYFWVDGDKSMNIYTRKIGAGEMWPRVSQGVSKDR